MAVTRSFKKMVDDRENHERFPVASEIKPILN
jgi:hypothetical protein